MSFDLGEPKDNGIFFERKLHGVAVEQPEEVYQNDLSVHENLFDTIEEVHYLNESAGNDDESLIESLVEKGCVENRVQCAQEENDMLLDSAPVTDIIDSLEQSLESPGRSSMTAAQGLLHLHQLGEHLPPPEHQQTVEQTYMSDEVFAPQDSMECPLQALNSQSEINNVNHVDYDTDAQKRIENGVEATNAMYTESVPDTNTGIYVEKIFEDQQQSLPEQREPTVPSETSISEISPDIDIKIEDMSDNMDETRVASPDLDDSNGVELVATDLSAKSMKKPRTRAARASVAETTNATEDNLSEKSDEQPKDLSVHRNLPTPHASPRRIDIPRAPSRESDAMQSPQPSGIPAVPSSPEIFTVPPTKSKQTLFLESLLSSPSPKMYTSEVTITKQHCDSISLGKHRKSASPTVTSCSDEMKKMNKEYGEPQEKRIRGEANENFAKLSKLFNKCSDDLISELIKKKKGSGTHKSCEEARLALKQLQVLKTSPDFNIPDPLLVPKDKLNHILAAPAREIPALLIQRPELRLPAAFAVPGLLEDPDVFLISLAQLENILEIDSNKKSESSNSNESTSEGTKSSLSTEQMPTTQTDQTSQPKPIPSMDALAGDIDAATSAALNQMLWLPYISQLEAMAACSQNMDFIKALNSSGYNGPNYPDLSQMFNPSSRFVGQGGFPTMPPTDYDNRIQFAMWQEAMNHANATASQRPKPNSLEAQMKEMTSKTSDVQNPYVHSTKNHQNKSHSSARTSPLTHNYNSNQRMNQNPFLQNMYPGMNPNVRPNLPLSGLQIPYFNPNMVGSQRSPMSGQQKSPTSPYYPNNNYLQSVKQPEGQGYQRSSSASSQESPRPRITVKSLQNLLEPTPAAAASGMRRASNVPAAMGRRREEPEVGSTTPLGEVPPHLPPNPHDPSSYHLWHPLFGNQKGYTSPWSWTTVSATGD